MEREIANVMKASGLRNFRYIAFPPIVFEPVARPAEATEASLPEPLPGEPELVVAPENTLPAPPEPQPPLPPLAPHPMAAPVMAAPAVPEPVGRAAPATIPAQRGWSQPQAAPPPRPASGMRLIAEATEAAAPKPPPGRPRGAARDFALLDDISTATRPRRSRTGRVKPGDQM